MKQSDVNRLLDKLKTFEAEQAKKEINLVMIINKFDEVWTEIEIRGHKIKAFFSNWPVSLDTNKIYLDGDLLQPGSKKYKICQEKIKTHYHGAVIRLLSTPTVNIDNC